MYEQLFKFPSTIARHKSAPYAEEREQYLAHCAQLGYSNATLMLYARELLWIARKLSVYASLQVTLTQIEAVAEDWTERERCRGQRINSFWARRRFIDVARAWLRFLGCLQEPVELTPFSDYLDEFVAWMKQERGLAATTIECSEGGIRQFLRWYAGKKKTLKRVFDLVIHFGTSKSPKCTRSSTANYFPGRPAVSATPYSPVGEHSVTAPSMAGRRVRMRALLPLWRASARRVISLASRLPGTTRLRFALHGGQRKSIQLSDIDAFLAEGRNSAWRRVTVKNMANMLKSFFRYAATRDWCSPQLAESIRGPRIFALEALPRGPDWSDVQRLLTYMDTDQPRDIRDRAILLLLAIYGLRESEVTQLRLDDIDWEQNLLHVSRVKRQSAQTYPLVPVLGNAIIRYLEQIRPASDHRQLFLTLLPPFRPLSRGAVYGLTQRGFKALSIQATHRGPHALRHACAAHLVAEGLSLKAIGDHLGHRSASATRIYAKVDLPALREVAAFDLGELL